MSTDEAPTIVVFRKWDGDGHILALFPELPSDRYGHNCLSYQHVGQHSGAWYQGCIQNSRPATPEEYAPLHRELTRRGYRLVVRQKVSWVMHDKRRQLAVAEMRARPVAEAVTDSAVMLASKVSAKPSVREPVLRRLEFDDLVDD